MNDYRNNRDKVENLDRYLFNTVLALSDENYHYRFMRDCSERCSARKSV